jgi:hypothetical protein
MSCLGCSCKNAVPQCPGHECDRRVALPIKLFRGYSHAALYFQAVFIHFCMPQRNFTGALEARPMSNKRFCAPRVDRFGAT